jgi:NAD(P)-dependent dehydrogenase (short-subunit alcohol dehydrogenase family)
VSGGARGLGLLMARELARRGASVVIFGRTLDSIGRAEATLRGEGLDVRGRQCDVRDPADVARLVSVIVEETGRLDLLVNNAGVIQVSPIEHARIEDFEASLETHFWGPLYLIRQSLPHLRETRGRILNIASIGGRIGVPHLASYCVGKFALVGLSETLRAELAKDGILVTTATPGLMRTGSHGQVEIRGQHAREAKWFGAAVATPLTSKNATRAARQIVDACVRGQAHVTPGIQARVAEVMNIVAPELTAELAAVVTRLLPGPVDAPEADRGRRSSEVGFGWMSPLLPNRAARRNNEVTA